MRNVKLILEYDGTAYCGFQRQDGLRTIQAELERAAAVIIKAPVSVVGAGRTDAGVHARGQVVNFRTGARMPVERFVPALNSVLPADIRVLSAEEVPWEFHARYDARGKTYEYTLDTRAVPSVFLRNYAYHVPLDLDLEAMSEASRHIVGRHDFRSFAASGGGAKTFTREVRRCSLESEGGLVRLTVEADGFLYNMVRIIVGTLLLVGAGKLSPADVERIRDARDRRLAGPTAPAKGLCLVQVDYGGDGWRRGHSVQAVGGSAGFDSAGVRS
ncbi:MAG: tRNA pseudouridine(38-40) synthase TruA [Firmicutes bacterium]|jgi:tRNA pseudouridine38-40 synthase|nr:tRNA pseudouridine(38-40) synthase TruA [Bacillota bacterium]MDH7496579.1 tRNA pseudouridine(38-40) synthase TruA [Bacillota bacterium]